MFKLAFILRYRPVPARPFVLTLRAPHVERRRSFPTVTRMTQPPSFPADELVSVPLDRTRRLTHFARVRLEIILNPNSSRSVIAGVALGLVLVPSRGRGSVAIVTLIFTNTFGGKIAVLCVLLLFLLV